MRRRLTERADSLRQDLRHGRTKLAEDVVDTNVVLDRKDQADIRTQAGMDNAEFERDLAELATVEAALRRLDTGHFGRCVACAEPIATERLTAQPWAMRCLACQTQYEQRVPRSAP